MTLQHLVDTKHFIMKAGILLFISFFSMVIPVHSETMYITDEIQVMVRSEVGMDHRILAMPKTGTKVEVLEEVEDGWSRVLLPNEKEGWMLTRYLKSSPPSKEFIAKLKSENETLVQRAKMLVDENANAKKERKDLLEALAKQTKTAKDLKRSYKALKKGSSEYLSLKASYDKVSKELAARAKQRAELEEQLVDLQDTQTLRWFISGSAVLLVGVIVGVFARRPRRRHSLL